jgi:hypothetical protein
MIGQTDQFARYADTAPLLVVCIVPTNWQACVTFVNRDLLHSTPVGKDIMAEMNN